ASICTDHSDAVEFFKPGGLYFKPIARVNICVQLPPLKEAGKSISNWEVMERIKNMIKPHGFMSLKIIKSTMEFIRFEGELENKDLVLVVMQRLESKSIKLSGFHEQLKVKAGEAKIAFPGRHDWDAYFRDARNMNEMRPGERPDTIHIRDIPTRWFASCHSKDKTKPSEEYLKKVFSQFGDIRCVDIPMLDPYRKEMTGLVKVGSINTFTFGQDLVFDAYIQYKEYIGFVKAMDRLRGMKMLYMDEEEKYKAIRKRRLDRERLEELEREREDRVRREREEQERKLLEEERLKNEEEIGRERKRQEKLQRRVDRRKEREQKRKQKHLERKEREEERKMQHKIALEERKFLLAQRKLESIRIMTELFERVKVIKVKEDVARREQELEEERTRQVEQEKSEREEKEKQRQEQVRRRKEQLLRQEHELREKILKKFKNTEEHKQEQMREQLRKKLSGRTKLKSAVVMKR
ncbi:AK17A-like protein, partial [Mya arenaria]